MIKNRKHRTLFNGWSFYLLECFKAKSINRPWPTGWKVLLYANTLSVNIAKTTTLCLSYNRLLSVIEMVTPLLNLIKQILYFGVQTELIYHGVSKTVRKHLANFNSSCLKYLPCINLILMQSSLYKSLKPIVITLQKEEISPYNVYIVLSQWCVICSFK